MFRLMRLFALLLLVIGTAVAQAAEPPKPSFSLFVSCIEKVSESGLPRVWFGYEASDTIEGIAYYGPSDGGGFIGDPPNTLSKGRHEKVFGVELQEPGVEAIYEFIANNGDSASLFAGADYKAPACGEVWQPGAPSIAVTLTSDCAFVEIRDPYGHWSRVQSNGEDVLLHYGEALIGGANQSTDPADYRAIETACPG